MTAENGSKLPEAAAIDRWVGHVLHGESSSEIPRLLSQEIPPLLSWIVRGGCLVQCKHCIFPFEGSRALEPRTDSETLLHILKQMPEHGQLVHEGRQLLPSQIPTLADVERAGYKVSLISNGQYAAPDMLHLFDRQGLRLDVLDISVDGLEETHNRQRANRSGWKIAVEGLQHGRHVLKPSGKLTSLFTLTALNYMDVRKVGELLTESVDEWHVTTMSLRPGIEHMRADERELASALEQLLVRSFRKPVFLRSYSLSDFVAVLRLLGIETAQRVLKDAMVIYNAIVLDIGIPFYFYPKSLQVNETLVIDGDAWWRLPFCIHHTLAELQAEADNAGNDISHFNVAPLSRNMDIPALYRGAAKCWWSAVGKECLARECFALAAFL